MQAHVPIDDCEESFLEIENYDTDVDSRDQNVTARQFQEKMSTRQSMMLQTMLLLNQEDFGFGFEKDLDHHNPLEGFEQYVQNVTQDVDLVNIIFSTLCIDDTSVDTTTLHCHDFMQQ
eukprot:6443707-Amphidinium_carterae.1